jgi:4-amino-4-deoxy-L-arabinose transferase-like glycosyltransferase
VRLTSLQYVVALAALAFVIRLAAVLLMRDITLPPQGISSSDDVEFHHMGQRLAGGAGYVGDKGKPTSFRAPGFPFMLATVYATVGEIPAIIFVLHCALGALACVLTYCLAREFVTEGMARLAGLLACFYLGHIYFATQYLSESLFVPLLTLAVWAIVRYLKGGSVLLVGVAGLLLGYATLTRPMALLLLVLMPPLFAVRDWRQGRWPLVSWPLYAVTFLGVVLPWTYRNYTAHGQFVMVGTNGGSTFYGANNDLVATQPRHFGYWVATTDLPHRDLIEAQPDEVSHDKMEWKLGLEWIENHPGRAALLEVFKLLRLWWLPDFAGGTFNYILRIVAYAPYFLLMALGVFRMVRSREYWTLPWLALHVTFLATILTALIFFGDPRFRDANLPVLMLWSALGAHSLYHWCYGARPVPAHAMSGH